MADRRRRDDEYLFLMSVFFRMVDSKKGQPIADDDLWFRDIQSLAAKLFDHIGTIRYLQNGTRFTIFDGRERSYIDHASISILARAAFETYLCFYYIYGDIRADIEARKLRHDIWELGGLLERQHVTCTSEKATSVLEQDKRVICSLLSNIEQNAVFHSFNASQQKKARKGQWRLHYKWVDLAVMAGFAECVFRDLYRYLCSYAHSGGLSLLQIRQAVSSDDREFLSSLATECAMLIMSEFVLSYAELFPDTRIYLEANAEAQRLVQEWHMVCRGGK